MTSDEFSALGTLASLIGVLLTLATLWFAKKISDYVINDRLSKRLVGIARKMRESEKAGNQGHLRTDMTILVHAIETNHSLATIFMVARIRKLYFAARSESVKASPNLRLIEGLLLNFQRIHGEVEK